MAWVVACPHPQAGEELTRQTLAKARGLQPLRHHRLPFQAQEREVEWAIRWLTSMRC